mmetsp:Transcript_124547/g.346769  ORF Transcript_124547/g.346769 Transcript_124547/m.346769 type:complete len:257 (+) Transcript_124547:942-1712(+)
MMQLLTSSQRVSWMTFTTSGYFSVMFSELRLYTRILSREMTWICARSPSYFHSPVKRFPARRSVTSARPLDGFASIGLTGTPSEMWQASSSAAPSRPSMSAPTTRSKLGISLKAWRTAASRPDIRASSAAAAKRPSPRLESGTAGPPARAGAVSTKAWARAWRTVGVWMPMRSLACRMRTMNFASAPREATSIFCILSFFAFCESLPDALATPFISAKTFSIVNLGGIISTFCATLLCNATSPRSFASPDASAALM